jgi:hypothetical protein
MEESTFTVKGTLKNLEVNLGLYGKTLLKCSIPINFLSNFQRERMTGKNLDLMEIGSFVV